MQANKIYKVAVFDEVLTSRMGLCSLANKLQSFKVVENYTFDNYGKSGLSEVDVLLYSTRSIDSDVIHKVKNIKTHWLRLPIVILAPGISRGEQFKLINLGINGLITKEATRLTLKESLQCVANNGLYYPESIIATIRDNARRPQNSNLIKAAFSNFQKNILQLLALDYNTPRVAEKMFRSTRTIEWHKQKMMEMVSVSSTTKLLLFAIEYGVIESPFAGLDQNLTSSEKKELDQLLLF